MKLTAIVWPLVLLGCTPSVDDGVQRGDAGAGGNDAGVVPAHDCPALFAQDILPEYHLDISVAEWAALQDELLHTRERIAAGLDPTPYHPVGFRYEEGGRSGAQLPGVLVRLKGNSSWLETIDRDLDPKMQLVIAFNEVDSHARFQGLRKVDLDMPRGDRTFLQQRLALFYMRAAGIEAPCANNARLVVNGTYYGLYTNLERPDKEYLQRIFPGAADGDLWKGGRIIKTNEDSFTWDRLDAFWQAGDDLPTLAALADLPAALREWATEAMIGDADGYQTGHPNYFLYDHPTRGFVWLPDDLDTSIDEDFQRADSSPAFSPVPDRVEEEWVHYLAVMNDPTWFERYVVALGEARARYDTAALQARVDAWGLQIAASAAADPRKPFTMDEHDVALSLMRAFTARRAVYIDHWLDCRSHGGIDSDGDGFDFCNDCDDHDAAIHPGAPEVCDGVDQDCDGRTDDVGDLAVCP